MTHTNSTPANPTPPGWPDPLESPQAEAIRNGKLDDTEIRNLFDCMERELRLHRERAANPAQGVSARHPLEVYADSYAEMARMGDGKVDCRSVEVDIRQNMIPITAAIGAGSPLPEPQIEHMVQQFLRWKLPDDFNPDGGIQFVKQTDYGHTFEPVGTNLFDYKQAKALVLHMLEGLSAIGAGGQAVAEPYAHEYGKSNGDGTFSVTIEKGHHRKPVPDWPIKPLYAHPVQPGWRPTHRHVKRGSEYMLVGFGKMQTSNWMDEQWSHEPQSGNPPQRTLDPVDMREVAIYRGEDGKLWVRPREEFEDGRFEVLRAAPLPGGAK
jgi:hypothetical protein